MKRAAAYLAFGIGLLLLVWLLAQADWHSLAAILRSVSVAGLAAVLCVYPVAIWLDALAWQPYLRVARSSWHWVAQLWKTQLIADAVLYLTPLGPAGSEATKLFILKHRHGIGYADATASLISLQLLLAIAQVPFLAIGLAIMLNRRVLSPNWQAGLSLAVAVIAIFMILVMVAVHFRWLQALVVRISKAESGSKFEKIIKGLESVEEQLSVILHAPWQFLKALSYAFINWVMFACEMWLISRILGRPISLSDAWAIESLVSLARAVTFFIPAHLGAQDGATSFAFRIFYGDPTFGIAVALVRRARELLWSVMSLPFGFADMRAARADRLRSLP